MLTARTLTICMFGTVVFGIFTTTIKHNYEYI